MFNEPNSKSSYLTPAPGVTKCIIARDMNFGNTLLCYVGLTYMFNKPNHKSSCLAPALGATKFIIVTDMNFHHMLWYLSST
jgi:hypothetical protein